MTLQKKKKKKKPSINLSLTEILFEVNGGIFIRSITASMNYFHKHFDRPAEDWKHLSLPPLFVENDLWVLLITAISD